VPLIELSECIVDDGFVSPSCPELRSVWTGNCTGSKRWSTFPAAGRPARAASEGSAISKRSRTSSSSNSSKIDRSSCFTCAASAEASAQDSHCESWRLAATFRVSTERISSAKHRCIDGICERGRDEFAGVVDELAADLGTEKLVDQARGAPTRSAARV
jgi:hypothetical protein